MSPLKKLEALLAKDHCEFWHNLIMPTTDGYEVFGKFVITILSHGVEVHEPHCDGIYFCDLPTAMTWCVAIKHENLALAQQIRQLGADKRRVDDDIWMTKALITRLKDPCKRQTVQAKLSQKLVLRTSLHQQIAKCTKQAKYLQIKGFNDEIERTRRPTPHRTNISSNRVTTRLASKF